MYSLYTRLYSHQVLMLVFQFLILFILSIHVLPAFTRLKVPPLFYGFAGHKRITIPVQLCRKLDSQPEACLTG